MAPRAISAGASVEGLTITHLWPLREDGVVLVLAVQGEALVAALEQAVDVLVAEVPAAVALAQVAAERAHVADLRSADVAGRRGQCRERASCRSACSAMSASLVPAPMVTAVAFHLDAGELADAAQADDLVRLGDVLLLQVEQVGAAGKQFGGAPLGSSSPTACSAVAGR